VLQLPGVSVVLVGMSSAEHLNENLTAPAYPLSSDELARISRVHSMGRQNGGKTDA
jgi:aryl-alcohol dehydrogenase-like predicted oxidoreductase